MLQTFCCSADGGRTGTSVRAQWFSELRGQRILIVAMTDVHPLKSATFGSGSRSNSRPNRERRPNVEPNANLGTFVDSAARIINKGTAPISRLRFRVIDVTGPGSDNTCGGSLMR